MSPESKSFCAPTIDQRHFGLVALEATLATMDIDASLQGMQLSALASNLEDLALDAREFRGDTEELTGPTDESSSEGDAAHWSPDTTLQLQ